MKTIRFDKHGNEVDRSFIVTHAPALFRKYITLSVEDIDTKKAGILLSSASDAFTIERGIQNDRVLGLKPSETDLAAVENWNELCRQVLGETFSWERMQNVVQQEIDLLFPFAFEVTYNGSAS